MSKEKEDMNGLGPPDKIEDMGDLYGNPINTPDGKPIDPAPEVPDFGLTTEEEEMLKKKLEKLRKQDPFIYR
jgi:hypothetical protein|tara:strand:- start:2611 stop:2826 length:216 start_codon:yes stop_codon:yes gene_type:complete